MQSGLKAAIEKRNDLALPLVLAGIASGGEVIGINNLKWANAGEQRWDFAEALERYAAMDLGDQLRALSGVVANAVTLSIESGETGSVSRNPGATVG